MSRMGIHTYYRVTAIDPITKEIVGRVESENTICDNGYLLLAYLLIDESGYDTGLTYCGIGTGNTAVAQTDTTLTTEVNRKQITSRTTALSGSDRQITLSTYFLAGECTYEIEEVAIFGHSTASVTPDSGMIWNHALLNYDNSGGTVDLIIDLIFEFTEAP